MSFNFRGTSMNTNSLKYSSIAVIALFALVAADANAATLVDNFTTGPSSAWAKATWHNGSPFGCQFTDSPNYIYPASGGIIIKADANYCGEMRTGENYTYGNLRTSFSTSNVAGTVASAFLISGGSGSTKPWEEMDIEILPSFSPGRVHFAVIHQAYNNGQWGIASGEKIYDSYAFNPVAIGTAGHYGVVWGVNAISFYAKGQKLWTVLRGTGSPQCATTVGSTTAQPTCFIPSSTWPVSNKSIRLNTWSGDGSVWPGNYNSNAGAYTWYDYVYYQ
jgi:beta-glucanase (GH16 family)